MKTINKSLALLFAAVAFTACTNESIEPIRPNTQSPTTIIRLNDDLDLNQDNNLPVKPWNKKVVLDGDTTPEIAQPTTPAEPHVNPVIQPRPMPRPTIVPVEQIEQPK